MDPSFDTVFDYSASVTNINNALDYKNTQLIACNTNLTMYNEIVGYTDLIASTISSLTTQQTLLQNSVNVLQSVLTEIATLTSCSDEIKTQLYQNFIILGCDTCDYMKRMLFNFESALQDADLIALLSDTTNTSSAKNAMANLVYNKYPLRSEYVEGLNLITN